MHTWVPILVEDVDNCTIPGEDELWETLSREYDADYLTVENDTTPPDWLNNLKNEDGTYSLKKEEIDKARKQLLDGINEAIKEYNDGKQDWGWTMYKVRKNYDFSIAALCVIDCMDNWQIAMYSDFEPSDEKLTLVGYINYHW